MPHHHPSSPSSPIENFAAARRRMFAAFGVLSAVIGIGAAGYWYLGWSQLGPDVWTLSDCIYMTAITITTVGFEEVFDLKAVNGGREWTLVLLTFGIAANLYVISAITSFFVESDFSNVRRYRRLLKAMDHVKNHYIVCGAGRTGLHVAKELLAVGERLVVIDLDESALDELRDDGALTMCGDATDDDVLRQAGIDRARGVVSALDDDRTNMFVVVTARQTNPRLRIVTKAVTTSAIGKLRRAGADAVVAPTMIGGMRLASELLRPHVVRFLDDMLRDPDASLRIEEATVGTAGPIVGRSLRSANLRESTGVLILAVREPDGEVHYVPPSDLELAAGQTLIAIGRAEQIRDLRRAVGDPSARA